MPFVCACGASVSGPAFCAACGRRAARLDLPGSLALRLPAGADSLTVALPKCGPAPLPYRASVRGASLSIGAGAQGCIDAAPAVLSLSVPLNAPDAFDAALVIESANADRRAVWWEEDVWQSVEIPLHVQRVAPACVQSPASRLVFADSAPVQRFGLWNTGDEPCAVVLELPAGYTSGQCIVEVPAGGSACAEVSRAAGAPEGVLGLSTPQGRQEVSLAPIDQDAPQFAVDLGRALTSVSSRGMSAPAVFPSALFVPADGEPCVGEEAVSRNAAGEAGCFVSDVPGLLAAEKPAAALPAERIAGAFLSGVMRALPENGAVRGRVALCLPMLDGGAAYRRLEQRVSRAALRAGFPRNTLLLPAPVAAACATARAASIAPGARLCVLDAGPRHATAAILEAGLADGGRVAFRPLSALSLPVSGDEWDARLLPRWIAAGKVPADPWDALWPDAAGSRPPLEARRALVMDGVRRIREDLCGSAMFTGLFAGADQMRRWLGCSSPDPAADAALEERARGLFPFEVALDYRDDVAAVAPEVWAGAGPALRHLVGQGVAAVVCFGSAARIPAQAQQLSRWAGAPILALRDPDVAVLAGALTGGALPPAGALPFRLSLRAVCQGREARHVFLEAGAGVEALQPLLWTWTLVAGDDLRLEVLAGNDPVASCRTAAEAPMALAVRVERDPLGDIRLEGITPDEGAGTVCVVLERGGAVWPVWEVRL